MAADEMIEWADGPCPEGCTGCPNCINASVEIVGRALMREAARDLAPELLNIARARMGYPQSSYTVAQLDVPPSVFDLIAKKLKDAGYGHAFMADNMIDMSGVALHPNPEMSEVEWRLSKDTKAMVGRHKFLVPTPEMKGKKCILQGPGDMPCIGIYDGDPQWKGVFPIPDNL